MPRIEHVAVWARDLDRLCAFYAEHFGAAVGPRYENASKGFASRFLSFASGARLEVMTTHSLPPGVAPGSPSSGFAHVAIALGSEDAVNALTAKLKACGIQVQGGPRHTGDGYYESVVLDPEGNRIELTV